MALASEILARTYENVNGPYPDKTNSDLINEFQQLDRELHLVETLTGLNIVETESTKNKNSILIFRENGELEIRSFREATDALKELLEIEKENPNLDVVLVKADTNEEIRMAFRNYFSDAQDFIRLLTEAQKILSI
ncbi:MAG: hypothetical protein FJ190_05235 [Gammaproteobacteria bacterium]|nr:hypothetical protein [Gammaproteobacteria bacterium]